MRGQTGGEIGLPVDEPLFVGRNHERTKLVRALGARDRSEPAGVALVVGPPGMGKTSLIERVIRDLRTGSDVLLLTAGGDELERELTYGVVDQLVRRLPGRAVSLPRAESPVDVGAWLVQRLDEGGEGRAILVVIDDAQLVDHGSLQAVTFAARRMGADRFGLLLATRPEGVAGLPPGLLRLVESSAGSIELDGFVESEVSGLAEALDRDLGPETIAKVQAHTAGHPLHTRVLLEQASAADLSSMGDLDDAVPSLPALVVDRLVECSDASRALLEALAILDAPTSLVVAGRVVGLDDVALPAQELLDRSLVVASGDPGLVEFRHRLVRRAVLDSIPSARRRDLHRSAAEVTSGAESLRHRVAIAAGVDESLAADLLAQAELDASGGRRAQAAHWYFWAAEHTTGDQRSRSALLGADHLLSIGLSLGRHAQTIERLPAHPLQDAVIGRTRLTEGRFEEAALLLDRAWGLRTEEDLADRELWGPVAEAMAVISVANLDPEAVVSWSQRLIETGQADLAVTMLCHGLALKGDLDEAIEVATQAIENEGEGEANADARLGRGLANLWSNRVGAARRDLRAALASRNRSSLLQAISARSHLADALLREGFISEAADLAELAIELVEDTEAVWLMPLPHSIEAYALTAAGDLERARHHADQASAYGRLTGEAPAVLWAEAAQMRIAEAEGDHTTAAAAGDRMLAGGLDRVPEGINPWRATYVDVLLELGRLGDADDVLAGLVQDTKESNDVRVATSVWRACGQVASRRGQHGDAVEAFESGLALEVHAARPLERGQLELAAGRYFCSVGVGRRGVQLIETAAGRFGAVGAAGWHERCMRELEDHDDVPPPTAEPSVEPPVEPSGAELIDTLTPRERLVSRLVAEGYSNQQVAAELVLSVKTVENHLSKVYAKLDVRSRTQMAALIGGLG